jgi:hypothetical protein
LIKSDVIEPGSPVTFLGRVFLDPFHRPDTIADVARQFRKLHLTDCPVNVPRELIMRRRALAYKVTDPFTPLLSDWADAVIRLTENKLHSSHLVALAAREDSYWLQFDTPFFSPPSDVSLSYVAENVGLSCDEVMEFQTQLQEAKTLDDCFFSIKHETPTVLIEAVIDGEVHAGVPNTHQQDVERAAKVSLKYCRDYQKNSCTREKCKFRHEKEPVGRKECFDFKNGKCKRGDKCKYAHG